MLWSSANLRQVARSTRIYETGLFYVPGKRPIKKYSDNQNLLNAFIFANTSLSLNLILTRNTWQDTTLFGSNLSRSVHVSKILTFCRYFVEETHQAEFSQAKVGRKRVLNFLVLMPECYIRTMSILLSLMPWFLASLDHQQLCYWLYRINGTLIEQANIFLFPRSNSARRIIIWIAVEISIPWMNRKWITPNGPVVN